MSVKHPATGCCGSGGGGACVMGADGGPVWSGELAGGLRRAGFLTEGAVSMSAPVPSDVLVDLASAHAS